MPLIFSVCSIYNAVSSFKTKYQHRILFSLAKDGCGHIYHFQILFNDFLNGNLVKFLCIRVCFRIAVVEHRLLLLQAESRLPSISIARSTVAVSVEKYGWPGTAGKEYNHVVLEIFVLHGL